MPWHVYYDGAAESCVYSSTFITYHSIDLCTNARELRFMVKVVGHTTNMVRENVEDGENYTLESVVD
jgi:hypothetical protein